MAYRKAKSWLLKPPPGTPLNWDHPLARYLINRWVAGEGAGTKLTDAAGRANATTSGTWVQGPHGPMVAYNGSSQAASAAGVKYKSASTLTVAFTYYRATNPSTYAMIMESSTNLGLNFNGTWNIWDGYNGATNTTGNYMTVSIAATVAGSQVTSAAISQPSAGRVHRIVATIDRRLTTDQITAIYVDGVAQSITYGTPVASKVTAASTFTDNAMYFAARGGSSFYNNCRLDDVLFETRLWTPAEVRSDYTDRYGMFAPPHQRMRSSQSGTTATIAWTEADDVTAIDVSASSTETHRAPLSPFRRYTAKINGALVTGTYEQIQALIESIAQAEAEKAAQEAIKEAKKPRRAPFLRIMPGKPIEPHIGKKVDNPLVARPLVQEYEAAYQRFLSALIEQAIARQLADEIDDEETLLLLI